MGGLPPDSWLPPVVAPALAPAPLPRALVQASRPCPPRPAAVTTVCSLEAAQACFMGGAAAYDCVLLEHSLLAAAPAATAQAFFKQAATLHAPVVLMAGASR